MQDVTGDAGSTFVWSTFACHPRTTVRRKVGGVGGQRRFVGQIHIFCVIVGLLYTTYMIRISQQHCALSRFLEELFENILIGTGILLFREESTCRVGVWYR
ncbi:unnamed protein product [Pylaiella littoralis]